MWDDLARGAIGTVVLVDTRRTETSFAAVDFFERRRIPFVVAVNCFDHASCYDANEIGEALVVPDQVPIVMCDARDRNSSKLALIQLVKHAMTMVSSRV